MRIDWISENLKGYLEEPVEVEFSEWTPWDRRNSISNIGYPGVYLIARFNNDEPPNGPAIHIVDHVIYIGVTGVRPHQDSKREYKLYFKDIGLRSRWKKFHRSAFEGKKEHAGGISYRRSGLPETSEGLYVAAYAHSRPLIPFSNERVKVDIGYLEELKRKVGGDPALGNHLNRAWRLYVERRCLFEYALASNGKLPLCNKE